MTQTGIASAALSMLTSLAEPALRTLVLAVVAGLVLSLLRVRRTAVKMCVWTTVLVAALAMPALDLVLPALPLRVLPAVMSDAAAPLVSGEPERADLKGRPSIESAQPPNVIRQVTPSGEPGLQSVAAVTPSGGPQTTLSFSWPAALLLVYLLGALTLLARAVFGWIATQRFGRMTCAVQDATAVARLDALAVDARLGRSPRLGESDACRVPLTMGIARPLIVLPSGWREWPETTLDAVLLHELAHVVRRDALTQALAVLHRSIFWFSPLGWWLHRHLVQLAEYASDEAVLAGGVDRTTYAETLLSFFTALGNTPRRADWLTTASTGRVAMAQISGPERRVERIFAWTKGRPHRLTKVIALAIAVVAIPAVAVVAAIRPMTMDIPLPYGDFQPQLFKAAGPPKAPPSPEEAMPKAPAGLPTRTAAGAEVALSVHPTVPQSPTTVSAPPTVDLSGTWKLDVDHSALISLSNDNMAKGVSPTLNVDQLRDGGVQLSESWMGPGPGMNLWSARPAGGLGSNGLACHWEGDALVVMARPTSQYSQFAFRLDGANTMTVTATPRDPNAHPVTAVYERDENAHRASENIRPFSGKWALKDGAPRLLSSSIGPGSPTAVATLLVGQMLDSLMVSELWSEPSAASDRIKYSVGASTTYTAAHVDDSKGVFSLDGGDLILDTPPAFQYARFTWRLDNGYLVVTATPRDPRVAPVTATYQRTQVPEAVAAFRMGAHMPKEPGAIPPRILTEAKPRYTPEAIRQKIQGTVEVECIVGADGSILRSRITKALDNTYGLDDQALQALSQWTFTPGTINGQPAAFVIQLELTFTLR